MVTSRARRARCRVDRFDGSAAGDIVLQLMAPFAVGLIMLPLMLFHMIQLQVCALIAGQLSREVSYG